MVALYAIVRIRGQADVPPDVDYTLRLLRLFKKYHLVLYPSDTPGLDGMLMKVKDWVTWGEIDEKTLIELLRRRGRIPGGKPLTDSYIEAKFGNMGIRTIEAFASALMEKKILLHKIDNVVKPVFRLHPPRGGFKRSIKLPYNAKGELGYRGSDINDLIRRML